MGDKRRYFLICIALLLVIASLPYVKAPWYYESTEFEFEGHVMYASYVTSQEKIILKVDNDKAIIEMGECGRTGGVEVCLNGYDIDDESKIKYENGEMYGSVSLTLNSIRANLAISRDFSDATPDPNDEVKITTIIENTGNEDARNVEFKDTFPKGITIVSSSESKTTSSVTWKGTIFKDKTKEITYTVKVKDFGEYETQAKATYESDGTEYESESAEQLINVKPPYKVTIDVDPKQLKQDKTGWYNITVDNQHEDELLEFEMTIFVPEIIDIKDNSADVVPKYVDGGRELFIEDEISANQELVIGLEIEGETVGDGEITMTSSIRTGGVLGRNFEEEPSEKISVIKSGIATKLILPEEAVKAGSRFPVEVELNNIEDSEYTKVKGSVASDMFDDISISEERLLSERKYTVVDQSVEAPDVDAETTYDVTVSGTAKGPSETVEFATSGKVTVTPRERLLKLKGTFDKAYAMPGDTITRTVKVQSLTDSELTDATILDVTAGFEVTGDTTSTIVIPARGSVDAYTYTFDVPANYEEDSLSIKSILNVQGPDDDLYKEQIESVLPIGGPGTAPASSSGDSEVTADAADAVDQASSGSDVVEPIDDSSAPVEDVPVEAASEENVADVTHDDEEPKGFFAKLWNSIFGWL